MIAFDKSNVIEGVTVYDDHADGTVFFAVPNSPRFRIDSVTQQPVVNVIKYKSAVERADGTRGGGLLICDIEFTLDDQLRQKILAKLQERVNARFPNANPKPQAQLGTLRPINTSPLGKPAAAVQLLDSGGRMVQKIQNPGQPSLYGNFVTPITVELTQDGIAIAEQSLQGQGGVVQVAYNLPMVVRIPPLVATVDFWASKFMSFHQEVDVGRNIWGTPRSRQERVSEFFSSSEFARVHIEPGMVTDQKVIGAVTDWGWATLDDAVKRMVLKDIDPVKDDDRKVDDSLSHLTRDMMVSRMVDFHRVFSQDMAMDFDPAPRGTLVNITSIPGVKWSDHFHVIDLDDPFFKKLNVAVQANADFQSLPIFSVDVNLQYGANAAPKSFSLKSPSEIEKFAPDLENNNWKYKYSYKVHYKGLNQTYQSPVIETDETQLTIDAGDAGILTVDLMPGDLDFDEVKAAQVTMRYEPDGMQPLEQQYMLTKPNQTERFQKVVVSPITKPYKYKVKYLMKDGKEFQADWVEGRSPTLMINDVWNALRTIGIRARGNFDTDVDSISLDLIYTDSANQYTQTKSVTLTKDNKFFDWQFPVISETAGSVSYSGTIRYLDNHEEAIPKTDTTDNTILVGPRVAGFLEVQVLPDMIDFGVVKLARVSLSYTDTPNALNVKKDLVFKSGATDAGLFKVELKDKLKTAYQWQAQFFLNDGSNKRTPLNTTDDLTLLPQLTDAQ